MLGPENKKMVLTSAASKWREFKSRFTRNYVVPFKDDPDMLRFPPDDYRFINADHWTAFVAERTKESFLVRYTLTSSDFVVVLYVYIYWFTRKYILNNY